MRIDPGRLNKRITIMRYEDAPGELGDVVHRLVPYKRMYAEVRPLRGKEYLEYHKDTNSMEYKVTVRYQPGITEKDVIAFGKRQLEIESIININEGDHTLEIHCVEKKGKVIAHE